MAAFFPTLPPEELGLLPNETVDACIAAANVRRYMKVIYGMQSASASKDVFAMVESQIAATRSGLKEDAQDVISEARAESLNQKYGAPVFDTSDNALMRMGFTKGPKQTTPDQAGDID